MPLRTTAYIPVDSADRAKLERFAQEKKLPTKDVLRDLLDEFPLVDSPQFEIPQEGAHGAFGDVDISEELAAYAANVLGHLETPQFNLGLIFQGMASFLLSDQWAEIRNRKSVA